MPRAGASGNFEFGSPGIGPAQWPTGALPLGGAKSEEVADYRTSREPGESAAVTCAAFAARLGTSEDEADAFLAWLNVGFACKEQYLAQEGPPYLVQEPSDAPSLRTTPSRSASSEDSQAADAAVAALPAAVSLLDDYIAE